MMKYMKKRRFLKIWMINNIILEIKRDNELYNYLKYHSYWYYVLTYEPNRIKDMIKEMKIELNLTTEKKLEDLNKKISFINNLFDILK